MRKSYLLICFTFLVSNLLKAQTTPTPPLTGQERDNKVVTSAVPFLTISPDARAAGMGDVGAATLPDVNSQHWNAAKYPFTEKNWAIGLSYTPWLNKLINDMSISYLSGYKKLSKLEVVAASLRYFDLGDVHLTNDQGEPIGIHNPREFAFDASYSRKLSNNFSMAIAGRFIHSNLIGSVGATNSQSKAGVSGAVDLSVYGQEELLFSGKNAKWAYGIALTNIGRKLTYQGNSQKDFIPMNLRLGTALTTELDPFNKFTFAIDANKLLVPSPQSDPVKKANAQDLTMMQGMFTSFGDAPGGFSEEINEIMLAFGAEYWYNDMFSGRLGYFYENKEKGNRKYLTFGLGIRYQTFGLDVAYLVPSKQNHPLAETLRFTLSLNFDGNRIDNTTVTE